jgi:hypothetical protein
MKSRNKRFCERKCSNKNHVEEELKETEILEGNKESLNEKKRALWAKKKERRRVANEEQGDADQDSRAEPGGFRSGKLFSLLN